jgi:hypothetical protein
MEQSPEKNVQETLIKMNTKIIKIEPLQSTEVTLAKMDYTKKTVPELKALCKEQKIKGISGKNKSALIELLEASIGFIGTTGAPQAQGQQQQQGYQQPPQQQRPQQNGYAQASGGMQRPQQQMQQPQGGYQEFDDVPF